MRVRSAALLKMHKDWVYVFYAFMVVGIALAGRSVPGFSLDAQLMLEVIAVLWLSLILGFVPRVTIAWLDRSSGEPDGFVYLALTVVCSLLNVWTVVVIASLGALGVFLDTNDLFSQAYVVCITITALTSLHILHELNKQHGIRPLREFV